MSSEATTVAAAAEAIAIENLAAQLSVGAAIEDDDDDDDDESIEGIEFVDYKDESQLEYVMDLVGRDLSEPYSSTLICLMELVCCNVTMVVGLCVV